MRIRAAVLEEFGKPLQVQEVDLAAPRAGEVLVRVKACGVCHTDLYTASGADPSGYAPTVLGHEGAGVVEAVGDGVESVKVGDHVVTLFSPECKVCDHCESGLTNICTAVRSTQGDGYLPDGTTRLSRGGEPIRHFMGTSTFAEAAVLPEIAVAKVHPETNLEGASLLACGATTGLAAAMYRAQVRPGSSVIVFGAGLVGLGAILGSKIQGAERIVCVDKTDKRFGIARQYGATETVLASDNTVRELLDMFDGVGADYTFEATGKVQVMGEAVETARFGWGVCTILGVAGKGEKLEIVPRMLITGRTVMGGSFGGAKGRTHVPQLAELYRKGELDLDGFVSHRLPLERVNDAFDLMEAQDGIRTVLTFD
ncbi:MAG: alcohol dehydrogenase catalytic domain-containing protein [Planctomycetota bacterium]